MKRLLFVPALSYWSWLVMSTGLAVVNKMGFSPMSLVVMLGIVCAGAVVEAVLEP